MQHLAVFTLLCTCLAIPALAEESVATPTTAQGVEYFERHIRPLFVQHCAECHGSDVQEAGLRLDDQAAFVKGSESGPVINLGEPDKSRLIEVLGYERDVQMPPDSKLPADKIEAVKTWIAMGAPWPADAVQGAGAPPGRTQDSAPQEPTHWAFRPIVMPEIPTVLDTAWPVNDVDRFVLAELEKKGLAPSPAASRRTLIRRATFDLIGVPPTYQEIEAFEHDPSPDAFATVIDRLLASPLYGQRWGRHWLDVARYADTKGYVFTDDPRYPYSYTYRDYVIRAFNEDLPFDRFVQEQIAADHLNLGADQRALAGLGFLTVGSRFMQNSHDIFDDRIDVVTRGLMGLTVTCARCHDHKYDPITQADYYSLYAIFASSPEPAELPMVALPEQNEAYRTHQAEAAKRQAEFDTFLTAQVKQLRDGARSRCADYLIAASTKDTAPIPEGAMLSLQPDELKPGIVVRWRTHLAESSKAPSAIFAAWHTLGALAPETFASESNSLIVNLPTEQVEGQSAPVNHLVKEALLKGPLSSMVDVARTYGELLSSIEIEWQEALRVAASAGMEAPTALSDPAAEELRQQLYAEGTPTTITAADIDKQYDFFLDRTAANEFGRLRREVEGWKANSPEEPPRAMAVSDSPTPHETHIFLRGNPGRPGDIVPRQFVRFLSGANSQPFTQGSGRLELAQAILAPENPLTRRVIVNRVWMHHFGSALVDTPSDFGTRSDPPTHPALLDYLAATLVEDGWSLKNLHRKLMLSRTYGQTSDLRPEWAEVDPDNRLYGRMNRRRLDFESTRDSLLAVAGRLDVALDGRPINLLAEPFTTRRTVYGFIDRGDLPGLFRAFDFASPDSSSPERPRTTVPQQALFLLNSPFVIEQAAQVVARPEISSESAPAARVRAVYQVVLGRAARPDEVRWSLEFVNEPRPPAADDKSDTPSAWAQLAQVLLATNEFLFVD